MINIGLLGCGRIGAVHARSIFGIDNARVSALADAFAEPAEALAAKTGAQVVAGRNDCQNGAKGLSVKNPL